MLNRVRIVRIVLLAMASLSFTLVAQKNSDFVVKHLKFQIFIESAGNAKLAWNGEQLSGTLTFITKGNSLEATWEFVTISPWENGKKVQLIPWICSSQAGGAGSPRITDLKLDGKQISFNLHTDLACTECVLHFVGTKNHDNDFVGTGLQRSYGDNILKKIEYRPVHDIQLPSNIVN
jgi:hypothetical protein